MKLILRCLYFFQFRLLSFVAHDSTFFKCYFNVKHGKNKEFINQAFKNQNSLSEHFPEEKRVTNCVRGEFRRYFPRFEMVTVDI